MLIRGIRRWWNHTLQKRNGEVAGWRSWSIVISFETNCFALFPCGRSSQRAWKHEEAVISGFGYTAWEWTLIWLNGQWLTRGKMQFSCFLSKKLEAVQPLWQKVKCSRSCSLAAATPWCRAVSDVWSYTVIGNEKSCVMLQDDVQNFIRVSVGR